MTQQQIIEQTLTEHFAPQFLNVDNESHLHSSGKGGNSHFKIILVSSEFEQQMLIARHRAVQSVLKPVIQGVHALGLHTYTPEEWLVRGGEAPESPACAGGGKH